MQSKRWSLIESICNVVVGYLVAILVQLMAFGFYDVNLDVQTHLMIGFWFTAASVLRSYFLRRLFNFINNHEIK